MGCELILNELNLVGDGNMKRLIIIVMGCLLFTPVVADVIDINLINGGENNNVTHLVKEKLFANDDKIYNDEAIINNFRFTNNEGIISVNYEQLFNESNTIKYKSDNVIEDNSSNILILFLVALILILVVIIITNKYNNSKRKVDENKDYYND